MGRPTLPYVLIVGDIVLSVPPIALAVGFVTVITRGIVGGRSSVWLLIPVGLIALLLVLVGRATCGEHSASTVASRRGPT